MKKVFLLLILCSTAMFAQDFSAQTTQAAPINKNKFTRFGMNVLPLSMGVGLHLSLFPLAFYIANENNNLISFGLDVGFVRNYNNSVHPRDNYVPSYNTQFGAHVGYGKLTQSRRNPHIHVGYLVEFHAGYAPNSIIGLPFYIGFHPKFVLETKMFLFTVGLYVDTSLLITSTVGLGFLL
ncbi:MAG: hypothetical protein ACRCTJ_05355 [Brevinema sp.]